MSEEIHQNLLKRKKQNMKEKFRDMLKRMRKFSEYLVGILEGENRDN